MSLEFSNINTQQPKNGTQVNYNIKSPCLACEVIPSYQTPVSTSTITGVTSSSQTKIIIPTGGSNEFLMTDRTYLRFSVTLPTTYTSATASLATGVYQLSTGCYIDGCGANSLIRSLQISYGSKVLEQIDGYNILWNHQFQNNVDQTDAYTRWSIGGGLSSTQTNYFRSDLFYCTIYNSSATVGSKVNDATAEFVIPLNSSILGLSASKALPVFGMVDRLTLTITWEDFAAVFNASATTPSATYFSTSTLSTVTSYNISNVFLHYDILKLSDSAMDLVLERARAEGGITIPLVKYYCNIEQPITQSTLNVQKSYDAYYSCAKSIFVLFTGITSKTSASYSYINNFVNCNFNLYYFKVGNKIVNNYYINSDAYTNQTQYGMIGMAQSALSFVELSKAYHATRNAFNTQMCYTKDHYANGIANTSTYNGNYGAFAIGCDLEAYEGIGDVLQEGMNTIGKSIVFTAQSCGYVYGLNSTSLKSLASASQITNDANGLYMHLFMSYDAYLVLPVIQGQFTGALEIYE